MNSAIQQSKFQASLDLAYKRLSPLLKWAGGKEQELKYILPRLPDSFTNYYEPFVGGGAVYTAIQCDKYFINDKSDELISLYRNIKGDNRAVFFKAIGEIIHNWDLLTDVVINNQGFFVSTYKEYSNDCISDQEIKDRMFEFIIDNAVQFNGMFSQTFNFNTPNFLKELQINTTRKIKRMKHLEKMKNILSDKDVADNIETSLKSAFYMHFRHIYNHIEKYKVSEAVQTAIFLFIRNFSYSGMFRYNSAGHFNVPYGGIGYNRKNFARKIDYLKSAELHGLLNATTIENLDFEDFFIKNIPNSEDFIFLDPPYDSEFSTYANNSFTKEDQRRLANYLIYNCQAKWMMVIKNTELMRELYFDKNLNIEPFDKTYLVSFMNRNDKNVEHLIIKNY
jgi:DNA adenine methylase